ncbi:hypothetical protein GCG21_08815 [Pseudactinotalea sp. HY160]|uniref:hypothetical protein n=1 Tax=Pseudactinotalea sp. HY160 TaxID=2654490 RepID=UPI00128E1707|nr:hypothetical protein [Pseudactinotalea sp. HY160]MPV50106.1 hypothetical protein [Pseudactinotalea sp. HY160]
MGSTIFIQYEPGSEASQAFTGAKDDARHANGGGGYTGTLAEKTDFEVVGMEPVTLPQASALAEDLFDDKRFIDKRGPAGAIPVCSDDHETATETVTIIVKPPRPGMTLAEFESYGREQGRQVSVAVPAGQVFVSQRVRSFALNGNTKVLTNGTGRVTKYRVHGLLCDELFNTQAQAREWAAAKLAEMAGQGRPLMWGAVTIDAVVVRPDGSPLVSFVPVVKSATVTVDVVTTEAPKTRECIGWLFFGWAST